MRLPSNNLWTQPNSGNVFGTLASTFNITFDALGEAGLSKRPVVYFDETDDADFKAPLSINFYNGEYYVTTSDAVFAGEMDDNAFVKVASSPTNIGTNGDALVYDNKLWVASDNDIHTYDGSSWTIFSNVTTSDEPHPMCVFESVTTYKVAVGNGHRVELFNTSGTASGTPLILPENYTVSSIRYRSGYLYVGTKDENGVEAKVFVWNGSGSDAQFSVPMGASWVFAMVEYGQSIAAVLNSGEVIEVQGGSRAKIAQFPIKSDPDGIWLGNTSFSYGRVFSRGMAVDGDRIYINIDGEVDRGKRMPSGVWCFDPNVGLYHRASVPSDKITEFTPTALASDTFTATDLYSLKTGDAIYCEDAGSLTSVDLRQTYYAIVLTTTTFKLAASLGEAMSGNAITPGGTIGGATFTINPQTTVGHVHDVRSGAIVLDNPNASTREIWSSRFIFGGDNDSNSYLATLSRSWNEGHLETQTIFSNKAKEVWKFLEFLNTVDLADGEEVVVKYRTSNSRTFPNNIEFEGSWDDTTTFSSTGDDHEHPYASLEVGDEFTILDGYAGGKTSHITAISDETTHWEVTLEDAIGSAGQTFTAQADKWKKLTTITSSSKEATLPSISTEAQKSPWIKYKLVLRGFELRIPFIDIVSSDYSGRG